MKRETRRQSKVCLGKEKGKEERGGGEIEKTEEKENGLWRLGLRKEYRV